MRAKPTEDRGKNADGNTITERPKMACMCFDEIGSCCYLTVLPGPAEVVHTYVGQRIFLTSVLCIDGNKLIDPVMNTLLQSHNKIVGEVDFLWPYLKFFQSTKLFSQPQLPNIWLGLVWRIYVDVY